MAVPDRMAAPGPTRRAPRSLLWVAGLLLAGRIVTGFWETRHPVEAKDLVQWRPIAGAEAEAKKVGKPVLYDFTAAWCPPCRKMAKEVFGDVDAAKLINEGFLPVRVMDRSREDGKNPPEIAALQKRFGVDAFPALVVVRPGRPPVILQGYRGKDGTLAALKDAVAPPKTRPRK